MFSIVDDVVMATKNANGVVRKKGQLPEKICAVCQKPMTWRKAWTNTWDSVRYCSDRCKAQTKKTLV
jgi:hypothetical protein